VSTSKGTPETLREAVQNGINESIREFVASDSPEMSAGTSSVEMITKHVLDYVAQAFSGPMCSEDPRVCEVMGEVFKQIKEGLQAQKKAA